MSPHKGGITAYGGNLTQCVSLTQEDIPSNGAGGASHLTGVRGDHLTLHVPSYKRTCHMGGGSITSHMGEPPHTTCPLTKGNISHGGHHCSQGEKSPHMMCPLTQEAIPSHGGVGITLHRGGGRDHLTVHVPSYRDTSHTMCPPHVAHPITGVHLLPRRIPQTSQLTVSNHLSQVPSRGYVPS